MMGSAAEHAGDAEVDHSFSAGSGDAQDRQLRSILRGDAAPSTSTEKSSPHSNKHSVQGAGPAERSPGSTSARQLASFAFPDGGGLRSALEQLTPAMPARAGGGHAHLTQPPERGGRSRDIVPDSEEEATPPDQDSRHSQPKATAGQHPDQPLSQAADLDSNARQPAAEAIPLCTPRGTQRGASAAASDAPGSAEKERLLALAAAVPAVAAVVALMESQRGSNSPNKRKLPLSRGLPQDPADGCGCGSGSPVSQALSTQSKGGSGNREGGLAALGSQRGGLSQPSPLCPTRLNRDRPADCGSQHDAAPSAPAPKSQPPNEGGAFAARTPSVLGSEPSAGGVKEAAAVGASAAFGGEASAGGLKEAAGMAEACMETREDGQINKRRRTDAGEETLGSHADVRSGHENSLKEHHAASQPSCRVGVREGDDRGELARCAIAPSDSAAREADSDVDIGGPEDIAGLTCSHRIVSQGDRLPTQFPPQDACSQGRLPSQAAETQMGDMHSSEEQDPLCGQPLPPPHLSLGDRAEEFGRTPGALLLQTPMQRSPWATPHFSHPHTTDRCAADPHGSDVPASAAPSSGPPAASLSGQNATMRVLSLDARPSPGWTPGLMCSGVGFHHAAPFCPEAGSCAPDALHRLARRAPLAEATGGPSLHQGSCQPPLMTQSGRLTPFQPGELQEQQLLSQGLHSQAGMDSHHFGTCHSLDGLLYVGSQNSDQVLPLSAQPLPSPPN
ncbi:hypothetical protein WJX75_000881 [Coccomyxa subellipsoidea]|uniref:Uncharacterized protein n=1 Tax=Coccomyxa subellipsoidea TaxID=248742 RepID=A0ABR2YIS3_9CHLO